MVNGLAKVEHDEAVVEAIRRDPIVVQVLRRTPTRGTAAVVHNHGGSPQDVCVVDVCTQTDITFEHIMALAKLRPATPPVPDICPFLLSDSCHSIHTMEHEFYECPEYLSNTPAEVERIEEYEYEIVKVLYKYSRLDSGTMVSAIIINKTDNSQVNFCSESGNISCIMAITPSTIRVVLYMFIGSTVSILTISGNLLVITSIIYFKQLHTPTNYLILSLAVADLLVGALVLLFNMALSVNSCVYFGDAVCKLRRSFDISLMTTSILNLCCIAVDRYHAVCQPLTYRTKINSFVVVFMILVSWSVSAVSGFGIIFLGLKNSFCEGRCFIFHIPNSNIIGSVVSFYIPVIIMLSIYLKILFVAEKQARSIQNTTCQSTKSAASVSKMEKKATKTLAIVMGVFLFCWTPFFLSITFNPLTDYSIPSPLTETLVWLGWSNSMLNPFVYGFFYSWFRSAFRIIISGKIFNGNFANAKLS